MQIVIFGLTVSSSWGNGHATLWRGLCRALSNRGHSVVFYEKDVPYYAGSRDLTELPGGGRLVLYQDFSAVSREAAMLCDGADLAITTSFCPDGREAARVVMGSRASIKAFYDLDTPVTLQSLEQGRAVPYLPADGLAGFDLVLSYTGGRALDELQRRLGARRVAPLYGWADTEIHHPVSPLEQYRADMSYLGTYAEDRQATLEALFIEPAKRQPERRFVLGGAQYPENFPWTANMYFVRHMPPAEHPGFFCSSRMTLNVTRGSMARYGYCPSGRLFEAAACGVPVVSDSWEGLNRFFVPGEEILLTQTTEDVLDALAMSEGELTRMAQRARARTLEEHSAEARAAYLERLCASLPSDGAALASDERTLLETAGVS